MINLLDIITIVTFIAVSLFKSFFFDFSIFKFRIQLRVHTVNRALYIILIKLFKLDSRSAFNISNLTFSKV